MGLYQGDPGKGRHELPGKIVLYGIIGLIIFGLIWKGIEWLIS